MPDNTTSSIFDLKVGGADEAAGLLGTIGGGIKDIVKNVREFADTGGVVRSVVGNKAQAEEASALIRQINSEIEQLKKKAAIAEGRLLGARTLLEFNEAEEKLDSIASKLSRLEDVKQRLSRGGGLTGEIDDFGMGGYSGGGRSAIGVVGNVAQSIGGNSMDGGLAQMSSFLNQTEMIEQSVGDLGRTLKGTFDNIAKSVQNARNSGGGLIGMLGGVVSAVNPVGIALGGLSIGLAALAARADQANREAQERLDLYQREIDQTRSEIGLQQQLDRLREQGDLEGANQLLQQYNDSIEEQSGVLATTLTQTSASYQSWRNEFIEGSEDVVNAQNYFSDLGDTLSTLANPARAIGQAAGESALAISEMLADQNAAYETYKTTLKNALNVQADLNQQLDERAQIEAALADIAAQSAVRQAAERLAEAEEELALIRQQAVDIANQAAQQEQQMRRQFRRQEADIDEQNRRADELALRDYHRQAESDSEDHREALIDIAKDTYKSIQDASKDYQKNEAKAAKAQAKALVNLGEELAESIADAEADFMKSELKDAESHLKSMAKLETQYNKERVKRLKDLNDELRDAEFNNDITAFINAQRNARKDLGEMEADHKDQLAEENQAYFEQRAEAQKALEEQLIDLRTANAERRVEMQEQYEEDKAERREQFEEQLAEIAEQGKERLAEEKARYTEQRQAAKEAFQQRQRDEAEARRYERMLRIAALQVQLNDMRESAIAQIKELEMQEKEKIRVIESGGRFQVQAIDYTMLQSTSVILNHMRNLVDSVRGITGGGTVDPRARNAWDRAFGSNSFGSLPTTPGGNTYGGTTISLHLNNVDFGNISREDLAGEMAKFRTEMLTGLRRGASMITPPVYS